jgi:hypothetical protein
MRNAGVGKDNVIRMNVHVVQDEHPDLFAELMKFGKGIRRIQRIKTLASERLLLGSRIVTTSSGFQETAPATERPGIEEDEMAAVQELCLPSLK